VLHDLSLLSLLSAQENVEFAASNGKVAPHFRYDGMTYYFASPLCAGEFAAAPDCFPPLR
jgi:YHS domain-containing protein